MPAAFEERWETFSDAWPDRLEAELADRDVDTTAWHLNSHKRDWGSIFKHSWWHRQDDLAPLAERDGTNDVRVMFVHRLEANREAALREHTLIRYYRNAGANDQAFIEAFNDGFDAAKSDIRGALPQTAELTGKWRNLIEARYDIPVDEHEDFFEASVAALADVVVDCALGNQELVGIVDELYDEVLEFYR